MKKTIDNGVTTWRGCSLSNSDSQKTSKLVNIQRRLCTTRPGTSKAVGILFALVASLAMLLQNSASAANQTWTGATDGNWNTTTNWSGGALPGFAIAPGQYFGQHTDTAYFNNNLNTAITVASASVPPNWFLRYLEFKAGAGAFTFSGASFELGGVAYTSTGGITLDAGVTTNQTFINTVYTDLTTTTFTDNCIQKSPAGFEPGF